MAYEKPGFRVNRRRILTLPRCGCVPLRAGPAAARWGQNAASEFLCGVGFPCCCDWSRCAGHSRTPGGREFWGQDAPAASAADQLARDVTYSL